MMKQKCLKGEVSYDYKNDTLFFKIKDREYAKSVDFEDLVLDVDKDGFITGIQIFDVSKLLKIDKETVRHIRNWEFHAKCENNVISLNLMFEMVKRNKVLVERGHNLIRESTSPLQNSEVSCKV